MIQETKVTRFTPVCDNCGWRGVSAFRDRDFAERQLASHKCDEHREVHDAEGGFRWWWGNRQRRECICNETWFVDDPSLPWECPKAVKVKA